jgi:hypothetical protein
MSNSKNPFAMKYRVLFNTETNYLVITASDVVAVNLIELYSSQIDILHEQLTKIPLQLCKSFCLGYLQGNNCRKALNSPEDFK